MPNIKVVNEDFEIEGSEPEYVEQDEGKILKADMQWLGTAALGSCIALILVGVNKEGQIMAGLWHFSSGEGTPSPKEILSYFYLTFLQYGLKVQKMYAIGGCKEFEEVKIALESAKDKFGLPMDLIVDLTDTFDDPRSTKVRLDRMGLDLKIRYWVE